LYHTLILFRLSSGRELTYDASPDGDNAPGSEPLFADIDQERDRQIYIMESTCPHLGADMSHAEIEECEDSVVAVCPWHGYLSNYPDTRMNELSHFVLGTTLI